MTSTVTISSQLADAPALMSSPPIPAPLEEHHSTGLCSVDIQFRFHVHFGGRRRRHEAPPPYSAFRSDEKKSAFGLNDHEKPGAARGGPVRVNEIGSPMTLRGWISMNWLVLSDKELSLHVSANKAAQAVIPVSDITSLERSELEPHALILETWGKRYMLRFKNDSDLYGWKDAILYHMTGVSEPDPRSFRHNVHVGRDPTGNNYTGLPPEWAKLLKSYPEGRRKSIANFSRPLPKDVSEDVGIRPTPFPSDKVVLRVRINTSGLTSIAVFVTKDTPLREVLERVCRKTKGAVAECVLALVVDGCRTPLNLDDNVADLKNRVDLVLIHSAAK
ncbi:hypothetical protein C8R47DRAFT_1145944 [Mycena vitilis]|nr:hypothetical protein C8R47DRAFT_1145944 [Mycena vitilis]